MNEVNEYLKQLLEKSGTYSLSEVDLNGIEQVGLKPWIYSKLTSKKFRKFKPHEEVIQRIHFALDSAFESGSPLDVVFFQGGYKLWRLPSSPNPDWAEFFNIAYILSYLAPIAAAYKPGIKLTYYFHTLLMEKHDNLTTEEIDSYMDGMKFPFDQFSSHLPKNLKLSILRDADIYSRDEYFEALESGIQQAKIDMKSWPDSKIADYHRMASLNIKWDGREDWTNLSEKEREEKIELAGLYEQAAGSCLPKVMERVKAPHLILLFTKSAPIFIGIGSTKTSIAKHWVGFGVLERDERGFYDRILTPSQYQKIVDTPHEVVPSSILNRKNFTEILVYPRLDF